MLLYHMGWADLNAIFYGSLQKVDGYSFAHFFGFFTVSVIQLYRNKHLDCFICRKMIQKPVLGVLR